MHHLFNHEPFYLITHILSQMFNTHISNLTNYSTIIYANFVRDNKKSDNKIRFPNIQLVTESTGELFSLLGVFSNEKHN